MQKDNNRIIIIRCVIVVLILAIICGVLHNVTLLKYSDERFNEFYSQENDFDVLFMGTSHMMNGVSPMEIWNDYGIVSYNFSAQSSRMATLYWMFIQALDHTAPELLVVDCAFITAEEKTANYGALHKAFDSMPFGRIKIQAVCDLIADWEGRLRILFPFSVYHSRWDELERNDFFNEYIPGKMGFSGLTSNAGEFELPKIEKKENVNITTINTVYLKKIVEECEIRGIDLLFTYLPSEDNSSEEVSYMIDFANRNNISFIGPEEIGIILDLQNDYANATHLNISGAIKVSKFIGEYISNNYDIQDRREDAGYVEWFAYHESYIRYREEQINKLNSYNISH